MIQRDAATGSNASSTLWSMTGGARGLRPRVGLRTGVGARLGGAVGVVLAALLCGCGSGSAPAAPDEARAQRVAALPGGDVLAGADPCSLLDAGAAGHLGVEPGKRADRGGTPMCRFHGSTFNIETALVEGPGVGDLVPAGVPSLGLADAPPMLMDVGGFPSQLVKTLRMSCTLGARMGQTARIDIAVYPDRRGRQDEACRVARDAGEAAGDRFPRGHPR